MRFRSTEPKLEFKDLGVVDTSHMLQWYLNTSNPAFLVKFQKKCGSAPKTRSGQKVKQIKLHRMFLYQSSSCTNSPSSSTKAASTGLPKWKYCNSRTTVRTTYSATQCSGRDSRRFTPQLQLMQSMQCNHFILFLMSQKVSKMWMKFKRLKMQTTIFRFWVPLSKVS